MGRYLIPLPCGIGIIPRNVMKEKKAKPKKLSDTITRSEPFAATIRKGSDGHNTLVVKSKTYYAHRLNKFKDGTEVTLEVHTHKPKRSDQQNRYYWGVYLPMIAKESGGEERNKNYIEVLHERFKGEFLNQGLYEAYGKKVWLKKSTTELSVSEFCNYIMDIEKLTNVTAPPTENYGLEPLRGGEATNIEHCEDRGSKCYWDSYEERGRCECYCPICDPD